MRSIRITTAALALIALPAHAQDETTADPAKTAGVENDSLSVIDESPYMSPRAYGMGGAVITVADDLDAAFNNPAGIGGLNWDKKTPPYTRKLYFPWLGLSANKNSTGLYREVRDEHASNDSAVGRAIIDAHGGQRQYARTNVVLGLVFGRTMIVPFTDMQLAATSHDEGSDAIDVRYRSMSGAGYGFSAQTADSRISIGYFGYTATRKETSGEFSYKQIIDKTQRAEAISDHSETYNGIGQNVGLNWRVGKTSKPTLGLMLKNIGDTTFKGSDDDLVLKQDLNAGFSLSPQVGKNGNVTVALQTDRLLDSDVAFTKKYRIGTELCLGGAGSYATFALRAGYNDAGGSGGVMLNLGLISLEAATFKVDIGAGNEKVIEQRYMGTLMVNVAGF